MLCATPMEFVEGHAFCTSMTLTTWGKLSEPVQTSFLMNYWNCSKLTSSSQLITQQYIRNLSVLTYQPRNLLQSTIKTSMQTIFIIWLSICRNNLAFWMRFQRMKEPLQGLEAGPGQASMLWRKVYLCMVIASLPRVFSPLMAWFPTLLLKDRWHMSVSFNTWNSLWSGCTCWIRTLPCPTYSRWTPLDSRCILWSSGGLQVHWW